MKKGPVESLWLSEDAERQTVLKRARRYAALTDPSMLPPLGQTKDADLPENYQSLGTYGLANLSGKVMLDVFPLTQPWVEFRLSPEIRYDERIRPEAIAEAEDRLLVWELTIQAMLESSGIRNLGRTNRLPYSFHNSMRTVSKYCLGLGNGAYHFTDDYQVRPFRADNWVCLRDSAGNLIHAIFRETIDPLDLPEDQRSRVDWEQGQLDKPARERMETLYTHVEWQPLSKNWTVTQEVRAATIYEKDETVNPYIIVPFNLVEGESYGRGYVETISSDLRMHDHIRQRFADWMVLATKMHPLIDQSSMVRPGDFQKPNGTPIICRVSGGQQQDIGMFRAEKTNDISVAVSMDQGIHAELSRAFLLDSAFGRDAERVTAYERSQVAQELQGAMGMLYATFADGLQKPLLARVIHQIARDRILPPLPNRGVEATTLTGLSAISRQADAARVLEFASVVANFGELAAGKIDYGVLIDILARKQAIYEPGLIKSNEQLAQERQEAMQQQLALSAGEQAIESTGRIAEQQAAAQTQQGGA